jgi:hypothetical protein
LPLEFLERYKKIRVGGIIRIRNKYIPSNHILGQKYYGVVPVHTAFADYILQNRNEFTVRTIQECSDDDVLIFVFEIKYVLGYDQVSTISRRVFNWRKRIK